MTVYPFARRLSLTSLYIRKAMRYLTCLLILFSASIYAGSIHKWVDENGNVYYGDSPPISTDSKRIRVTGAPSDPGRVLPRLSNTSSNVPASDVPRDQAQTACQFAKDDLAVINRSSRIQTKVADGTTRYMTTEEIAERKVSAEKDIERFCQ